jgi:hypothetical protein
MHQTLPAGSSFGHATTIELICGLHSNGIIGPLLASFIITDSASILNRLGDVGGLDFFRACKVGDGAADLVYIADPCCRKNLG